MITVVDFLLIDAPAMVTGALAAVSCALVGVSGAPPPGLDPGTR